jgi:large repetitive protein
VYSAAAVNDGNWHDLTITRTVNANGSSTVSIYVDGALSNSGTIAADASIPTGIVTNHLTGFGYTNGWNPSTGETLTGDVYYKGALDDAHIYNHVLTADQAKAIYTVENGYETQAVANDGDAIKLVVTDTNTTALHVTGVENGMTITDGTAAHTVTSTGNAQSIDLTGWNLNSLQLTNVGTGSANLQFDATDTTASGQTHDATTWISVVNGTALVGGTAGNDTLNASAQTQAMFISGGTGNDTITGGSGNDRLLGGTGNDAISGGAGNDLIVGGTGTDSLTGGGGNDVFRWEFGDHGTAGAPNVGTITDFSSAAGNKDVLDLRDLLPGANHDGTQPGNIANYLHFDLSGSDTVIHVSSSGGFSNGYVASAEDETIILKGVDLTAAGTQNDLQIIHTLLNNGQVHLG